MGTDILPEDSRKNREYSMEKYKGQEDQDDFLQSNLC